MLKVKLPKLGQKPGHYEF